MLNEKTRLDSVAASVDMGSPREIQDEERCVFKFFADLFQLDHPPILSLSSHEFFRGKIWKWKPPKCRKVPEASQISQLIFGKSVR